MQVSIETTDNKLERKLRIEVPAERVEREVNDRLRSLSKRARLKGFRPGKAPLKVIEQQYGPQVRQEVLADLMKATYTEALIQEKLNPAGSPLIEDTQAEPGAAFRFTATIELYPEMQIKALDAVSIDRPVVEIADADVDRMLKKLRKQRAAWNPVERPAATGDRVTIDFQGTLDGEPFEGGSGEKVPVVLGEGRFVAGFEVGLEGTSAGDNPAFDVEFPSDYPNERLAGQTAHFTATVHEVAAAKLPEVDDAFCALFGIQEGGVEALRAGVRANMQAELDQAIRRGLKKQALDGLLSLHEVDLPAAMVRDEIGRLKAEALERMGAERKSAQPNIPDELFMASARRRVALGLLVAEMIRKHGLKLDRMRVQRALEDIAGHYDQPQQVIDAYSANRQLMDGVEAMVMEEQVVDKILEQAKVKERPATFDEIMNQQPED